MNLIPMNSENKLKVGVLVSGRGTNLQAILDASREKRIAAEVVCVISNKKEAPALDRAKRDSVPTFVVSYAKGEPAESTEKKMIEIFRRHQVELVVLAGFMRILTPAFINEFPHRIINVHPALLPAFPGLAAQEQAFNYGVKVTGATVHVVDAVCDGGPILLQETVPVLPEDTVETLSARILKKEHEILPKAIDLFAKNKVHLAGRKAT